MSGNQENNQLSQSDILLNKMIREGVNPDNECLYDTASLKFKFNQMIARSKKHLNDYEHYDGLEIDKSLKSLKKVLEAFKNEINLNASSNVFDRRLPASTPISTPNHRSLKATRDNSSLSIYGTPEGRSYAGQSTQSYKKRYSRPPVPILTFTPPTGTVPRYARSSFSAEFQAIDDLSAELNNMIPRQTSTPIL